MLKPREDFWNVDDTFMSVAIIISLRSKDPNTQVGACLVDKDNRIIGTGYNGFPRGIEDTDERLNDREQKYPRIVHAEANALLSALYSGVSVRNATIYVYGLPVCPDCTKLLIQAGIKRVVISPDPYVYTTKWTEKWDNISKQMIEEVGDISVTYRNSDKLD